MQRDTKKFEYQLTTDGISVSILFSRISAEQPTETWDELKILQEEKYRSYGEAFKVNEYTTLVGIDPGYKLYLDGVVKNLVKILF